jgi:hypothetical protein
MSLLCLTTPECPYLKMRFGHILVVQAENNEIHTRIDILWPISKEVQKEMSYKQQCVKQTLASKQVTAYPCTQKRK